jgi:alkanesulfonate monooxygenase SsuD/methylene tetrahydromethanopterin reductase-like flavin-dependent oxidoreductase (luciferase family)
VDWFFNRVTGLSAATATPRAEVVRGYEMSMNESARTQTLGKLNFDALTSSKAVVCGDPETCVAQLREIRDRLGLTELILWFNLGGIGADVVERSMKLAAAEVLPHL